MPRFAWFFVFILLALASCSNKKQVPDRQQDFNQGKTLEVSSIDGQHYIAIAVPLTGPYRHLGNTILEAAILAVEDFNKTISPNHKIGTLVIDDGGLVSEALARADLVTGQNCLGVVGHLNSEISVEAARKYSASGIAAISPASTNPKLTSIKGLEGYIYRTIGNDIQLAELAADYITKDPSVNRVAIFYNDRPYGISVGTALASILQKTTKQVVLQQRIPVRTTNHKSSSDLALNAKADLVFFVGEYNDAAYLLSELKASNPSVKFMATEGVYHQEFINIAGKAAEGALVLGSSPISKELNDHYQQKYSKAASGYVGTSYQATRILLDTIKANNFKNSKSIAKSLSLNPIFDGHGNLKQSNFVIYKVVDSQFKLL